MEKKLGIKNWVSIILIGLIGQIAWAVENQYINLWVYSQTNDSTYITYMTMASAVVATLTTFFMGALSDRLGKRKIFIAGGYCIWGITVFLFGLASFSNMKSLFGAAHTLFLVGLGNVIIDCLMTFFGSTSNDACFNAYVTDVTNNKNRPLVESILSILPLIGTALMLVLGMIFGVPGKADPSKSLEENANAIASSWLYFFLVLGIITTLVGVASFFLLPKDNIEPNRRDNYFKNLIYGFRPKTIKENKLFYITLLAFMFFNIAMDAFMPYYMVYFTDSLGIAGGNFYLAMGIIIGTSSVFVIVLGIFMERIGKMKLLIPSIALAIIGSLLLFFLKELALVILGGSILMGGYLLGTATLGAELRDQTPKDEVGLFQGVRMVFVVMLPMIIGSKISDLCFQTKAIENEFGELAKTPDRNMFIVASIAAFLAIAPSIWLIIAKKKAAEEENI